jgi:hypothetical protein
VKESCDFSEKSASPALLLDASILRERFSVHSHSTELFTKDLMTPRADVKVALRKIGSSMQTLVTFPRSLTHLESSARTSANQRMTCRRLSLACSQNRTQLWLSHDPRPL